MFSTIQLLNSKQQLNMTLSIEEKNQMRVL